MQSVVDIFSRLRDYGLVFRGYMRAVEPVRCNCSLRYISGFGMVPKHRGKDTLNVVNDVRGPGVSKTTVIQLQARLAQRHASAYPGSTLIKLHYGVDFHG